MITNNGHRLAFHVTAGRKATIVLDAGGGEDSSYWAKIVPPLSRATGAQIITYDRAGTGDSDEVPGPWKVQNAVSDLKAGLDQLGVTGKVLLVAHSQAGEVATYFARQNPHRVGGAVLVDASLPDFYTDPQIARIVAVTTPQIEALKAQATLTKPERQLIATAALYTPMHHRYHQVTWPKSIPAAVIVSTGTPFEGSAPDMQHWRDAQADFAARAADRDLVVADSSHDIPLEKPDLVIQQIRTRLQAH
nr:alpha/beta hydrolase [Kineosporia mesophila]